MDVGIAYFGDGHEEPITWSEVTENGHRIEFLTESGRYLLVCGWVKGMYYAVRWYKYDYGYLSFLYSDVIDHIELY